jgi:hypothetical protein
VDEWQSFGFNGKSAALCDSLTAFVFLDSGPEVDSFEDLVPRERADFVA